MRCWVPHIIRHHPLSRATWYRCTQYWLCSNADWAALEWEKIMDRVTSMSQPDPALFELSFRKLSTCKFRPPLLAMHRDLNYLAKLCTSKSVPSMWSCRQMVKVFNSCALIGYVNPELMSEMSVRIISERFFSDMDHVELAAMIKALSKLGQVAKRMGTLQPCGVFFGISEMVMGLMNEMMKPERIVSLSEKHIAEIWTGLARLRFYQFETLRDLSVESVKPERLKCFEEGSLVAILYSVSMLQFKSRLFVRALLDECLLPQRLRCYTPTELIRIYQSLTLMESACENALKVLDMEIGKAHRLREMSEQHLVLLLTCCGLLRWFNIPTLSKAVEEIRRPERSNKFTIQGLDSFRKIFLKQQDIDSNPSTLKEAVLQCIKPPFTNFLYQDL